MNGNNSNRHHRKDKETATRRNETKGEVETVIRIANVMGFGCARGLAFREAQDEKFLGALGRTLTTVGYLNSLSSLAPVMRFPNSRTFFSYKFTISKTQLCVTSKSVFKHFLWLRGAVRPLVVFHSEDWCTYQRILERLLTWLEFSGIIFVMGGLKDYNEFDGHKTMVGIRCIYCKVS